MAVLSVGVVLLVVFGVLGAAVPVPYVAQVPGPTFNTLGEIDGEPIITVEGRERTETEGELTLTTVGVSRAGLSLVEAVQGWFDDEVSVVPEETVYPPGRSEEETREANRRAFLTSEEAAEAAALAELGYPVKVVVRGLSEDSPAEGRLQEGDAVESVGGRPTPDLETLDAVLRAIPGGTEVTVAYTRLGRPGTATVTTRSAAELTDGGATGGDAAAEAERREGSLLGVLVLEQPAAPFDVDIAVEDVGGPSAGLVLALGILELVGGTDLTGGSTVAGTGTIGPDGRVGPIGGIQLKMIAATEVGAELFLVPADNCAEALAAPQPQPPLARVATLDDALTALADLRAGRTPVPC
ncbi:PDZ domain-containing protein [Geodermatophilus pulveris]|uniref:PDZ domain-containing protein n=2 Tax=Geodermatophilus pulveris TaxID=1564159 RepID=A0A239B5C2_9ACTN|nr:PDZ domain-containing protein [Geodermatophilus pulveris]